MNTYTGRRRLLLQAALPLALSILLEQWVLVPLFPGISGLGGIRPMLVFLDIPLPLPAIDLIPVGLIFSFFYSIVLAPGLSQTGNPLAPMLRRRVNAVFAGALAFLGCLAAGGGLFYVLRDYLPREVRNGIDSFGIQADIYLPYPMEGTVHLRGSMLLLAGSYFGMRIWMRAVAGKTVKTVAEPQAVTMAEELRRKEPADGVAGPGVRRSALEAGIAADILKREGRKITMQVPEPVLAGRQEPENAITGKKPDPTPVLAGGSERVRVLRPEAGTGRGRMYPCVVDGELVRPVGRG
jgi:hypothetical protein